MVANVEQAQIWNDAAGRAWVDHADDYDATLAHFGEAAIERLAPKPGERVVDIGCGTGATTLRLASMVAPALVVGVDLSHAMLAAARERAAAAGLDAVEFEVADVQVDPLPGAPFDLAYSRFGVMFFSDPATAFRRIAAALVPGGRLAFVCFGGPFDNPFITAPIGAASRTLGVPPPLGGPTPFSLAEPAATASLLAGAGLVDVTVEPGPDHAVLGADHDLPGLAHRLISQNPTTSAALAAAAPAVRTDAIQAAAEALAPHASEGVVRMAAATWIVSAFAP